jgi:NADPH:quinone reductase-like Zn-dependent oxidoreductase
MKRKDRGKSMKAIIWTRYHDPEGLVPGEIPTPEPGPDEVLIRIKAAGVTAGDGEMRRMKLPLGLGLPMRLYAGWRAPKRIRVLGQEFAGVVAAVGENVGDYSPGDEVFGTTGLGFGAYAEYLLLPEKPDDAQGCMAAKPRNCSFAEAAALPTAGMEALHFIDEAGLRAGDEMLIIGAGGSIGGFCLQLAKLAGARVIAVDRGDKLDYLRSLGADEALDFARDPLPLGPGRYRAIIDVVGAGSSSKYIHSIAKGGGYFVANPRLRHIAGGWAAKLSGRRLVIRPAEQSAAELSRLAALVDAGELKVPLYKVFPLEEASEAHRMLDRGDKRGNVALVIDN